MGATVSQLPFKGLVDERMQTFVVRVRARMSLEGWGEGAGKM